MPARESLLGLVIAGGRSSRFGGEKAVAEWRGRPLLLWAVERLRHACVQVAVNARPGTETCALAQREGLLVLVDEPGAPDGPLSGVQAGLKWAEGLGAASLAVSPCDVPGLPDDLYVRLAAAAGDGAAMVETSEGRQPLCAVWPVSALAKVTQALAGGAHPPTWRMLEEVGAAKLRVDPAAAFANINTREDLARLEAGHANASHQR
jgi:molybdopterin-guanine dinucleotide biosynthesis protein A